MKADERGRTGMIGEKYEILEELGRGGAGQVYRVHDSRLSKEWAAKRVRKDCPGMEQRVLGAVQKSIFPRIVDVVEEEEYKYLIMDWIEGETLQKRLERAGGLGIEETVKIGVGLCTALGALHAMQPPLLYLDCKPSNVMIDREEKLWLIDFGSVVEQGGPDSEPIAASPGFAAPEQLRKNREERRVDARSDVFSLGRTLYAMLTGSDLTKPPGASRRLSDCVPDIPGALEQIVEKCMEPLPENRFQTMEAVKGALKRCGTDQQKRRPAGFLLPFGYLPPFAASLWQLERLYVCVRQNGAGIKECAEGFLWLTVWVSLSFLWGLFAAGRRSRRHVYYEPLQTVLRTEKKPGRWMTMVLFLSVSILLCGGQARADGTADTREDGGYISGVKEEKSKEESGPPVILRDDRLRKLLLQDGAVLETDRTVYLELDPDLFHTGEELSVVVSATGRKSGRVYFYSFLYCPQ